MTTASDNILTTSIDSTGILSLGTGTTTGTTLGKSGQDTNIAGNVNATNITISNPEELNSVQISQDSILVGPTGANLELTHTQIKVNGIQGSAGMVLQKSNPENVIGWGTPAFVPTATESLNMSSNDINNIGSLNAIPATTMNINGQTQFDTPPHIPDPILGNDAASKGYIDTLIGNYSGNGLSLYFNYATPQADPIIAPSIGVLQQTLSPINSPTSNNFYTMESVALGTNLISTFTTDVGFPNTLTIPAGLWSMLIWGYTTSQTGQLYYYFRLNEVDSAGAFIAQIGGTSGFSSDVNATSSTDPDAYHCSLAIVNGHTMASASNRLQIQILTTGTGTGSAVLSTLFGGDYYSNITTTLNGATSLLTQNNTWTGVNDFSAGFNTTAVDSATSGNLNLGTTNSVTTTLGQTATGTTTNVKGTTINVGDDTSTTNVKGLRVTNIDSITAGTLSIGDTNTSEINLNSKPVSNLALAASQYINIGTTASSLTTPTVNQVGYVIKINTISATTFGLTPATLNHTYSLPAGSWITSATAGINCTATGTVTSHSLYIYNPTAVGGSASKLVGNQRTDVTRTFAVGNDNMIANVSGILFCPITTTITLSQELVYTSGTFSTTENNFCWYFIRIA
jgi:hypothetical protein